jgi:glycosyltransferase involved in cell wall biosynthesis
VFKNADVILLSKYLYLDIQKYMPENRVHYCPNGIPEEVTSSRCQLMDQVPIAKEKIEILFLSNLIESKGVFVLLEACKILLNKHLNFHCTFIGGIGDVSEQRFWHKVQKMSLEYCVTYAGKKYNASKESELAASDIFAFPTHNECFPLVLLEAMQHNLPVVSTFEGGILDIVENGVTGFLVPQKDAQALAGKLELLIQNKKLREDMGRKGRLRYEQNFTSKHFEVNLSTILANCLLKRF